jgi:hypothetical protein
MGKERKGEKVEKKKKVAIFIIDILPLCSIKNTHT